MVYQHIAQLTLIYEELFPYAGDRPLGYSPYRRAILSNQGLACSS